MTAAPTLEDVAARVGVSVRTVSRVLRDEGGYSAATEQRVRDVVDELRYAPNLLARRLGGRRSGVIGLLGPDMADRLVSEFTGRLERAARRRELTALSASTFGDPDQQRLVLASMRTCGVDGVIASPVPGTDEQLRRLAASGTPVVAIDRTAPGDDRARTAEAAVDALIELIEHPDAALEPVVVPVEPIDRAST